MDNISKVNCNLVFSTGRCGTAYLAQIFSHQKWNSSNKNSLLFRNNDSFVISHEKGFNVPVKLLKKQNILEKETLERQAQFINNMVKEVVDIYPKTSNFFSSNMNIARHVAFGKDLTKCKTKIIYIERDRNEVAASYMDRLKGGEKVGRSWQIIFYHPSDASTINRIDLGLWEKLSFEDKLKWNWDETRMRWDKLKELTDKDTCFEIKFPHLFEDCHLQKLSDFVGMDYKRNLVSNQVNIRDKSK